MLAQAAVQAAQFGGIQSNRVFVFGDGEYSGEAEQLEYVSPFQERLAVVLG
jgi:hypothetical protein